MIKSVPSPIKRLAQSILGERRYHRLGTSYYQWCEDRDPRFRASLKRITSLKDKHWGERCFIIGNGPSLRKTDLSLLRDEATFGLNRIYMLFDELAFSTTYYVAVNRLVIEQCAHEIKGLPCPKFISRQSCDLIEFTDTMIFLQSRQGHDPRFSTDIAEGVWEGATVTYVALQIAYYMGFAKVILVGVDHSYSTKGKPSSTVVSEGDDLNHFDPRYFGKGFRWQLPCLETSELAYRIAKHKYKSTNREIVDATVDGRLLIFPKVDYQTLF